MQERSIVERVEILEKKVEALETLPDRMIRVEVQLVQLRDEMRAEFSAIRGDTGAGVTLSSLRDAIRDSEEKTQLALRDEIRAGDEETRRVLREEIRTGDEETRRVLREEIRTGDEETRRYMRVLHEDVMAKLAIIEEGRRPRKKR